MDGAREYYTKQIKSEKNKYHMISYVEFNKIKREDKPRNRLLTIENELRVTRGEVGECMDSIGDGD